MRVCVCVSCVCVSVCLCVSLSLSLSLSLSARALHEEIVCGKRLEHLVELDDVRMVNLLKQPHLF